MSASGPRPSARRRRSAAAPSATQPSSSRSWSASASAEAARSVSGPSASWPNAQTRAQAGRGRPKRQRRDAKLKAGATEPTPAAARPTPGATPPKREAGPSAQQASLKWPTAKAGVALAAVAAVAVAVGVLLEPAAAPGQGTRTARTPRWRARARRPLTRALPLASPRAPTTRSSSRSELRRGRGEVPRRPRRPPARGPGRLRPARHPLVAVRDGIVLDGGGGKSFYSYGGGNTLAIYSRLDDRSYIYLHMLKPTLVRAGERVNAGQLVGYVGCTGSCDGPHLHFEVRRGRAVLGPRRRRSIPCRC